jgi:hypothetical protein
VSLPSATALAGHPAFTSFVRAADASVEHPHAVARHLRRLIDADGWLAPADRAPGAETYRQHLLHVRIAAA